MVCKSFHCKRCNEDIPVKDGDLLGSIRDHYWDKHRPTMMKGAKKRRGKRQSRIPRRSVKKKGKR